MRDSSSTVLKRNLIIISLLQKLKRVVDIVGASCLTGSTQRRQLETFSRFRLDHEFFLPWVTVLPKLHPHPGRFIDIIQPFHCIGLNPAFTCSIRVRLEEALRKGGNIGRLVFCILKVGDFPEGILFS